MNSPLLIIVYDRLKHLENCVNSLALNKESENTDLFIAIDYPYKTGDEYKISQVIKYCKRITGFKSVELIIRDRNYGPVKNYICALFQLFEKYSTVITFEDDNIVSSNFLDYMNQALEFYKNDERIYSVCGFNFPMKMPSNISDSCYVWNGFNAYGCGWWRSKFNIDYMQLNNFEAFLQNDKLRNEFHGMANHILPIIFSGFKKNTIYEDAALSYNLFINQKYQLYPTVSKVRNTGYDTSGVHCDMNALYLNQPIDDGSQRIKFIRGIQPDLRIYKSLSEFFKISPEANRKLENSIKEYLIEHHLRELNTKKVLSPVTGKDEVTLLRKISSETLISNYKKYNVDVEKYFRDLKDILLFRCNRTGYKFFYPYGIEGDGEFYSQLKNIPWYYMENKWEFSRALELIADNDKVLEIGSGDGHFIKKLIEKNIDAVGLELSEETVRSALEKGLPIISETIEEHKLSLVEKYDVICAFQVLEHISDVNSFILNCLECLKEEGRLIFSVPNHSSFLKYDDENIFDQPPHHMGQWTEEALKKLAPFYDLEVNTLVTENLASYHYDHYLDIYKRTHSSEEVNALKILIQSGKLNVKGHTVLIEYVYKGKVINSKSSDQKHTPLNALKSYYEMLNDQKPENNQKSLKLLNLGCGDTFHDDWINMDINPKNKSVIQFNLENPLPFQDNNFDGVYHSHLLEHISRNKAANLIKECYRVLKVGGVLRVVVPDLEQIVLHYIDLLQKSLAGDTEAQKKYEWIMLELFDQMVRNYSGGGMLKYWQQENIPAENYMYERVGFEAKRAIENIKRNNKPETVEQNPDPLSIGLFRLSGEIHQWMYDRYSLSKLLSDAGFKHSFVTSAHKSSIPDFGKYYLDIEYDSSIRKPDSLFMEAIK